MRRARVLAIALGAVLALAAWGFTWGPGAPASAAPTVTNSINGTWQCCGAGGASSQTWVISNNGGEAYEGTTSFATIQVSYNWPAVGIETIYTDSTYTATFDGTITDHATVMSGTWTSDIGQSGTWTATLGGAPPTTIPVTPAPTASRHDVEPAPIARSLGTPGEVFHSVPHDIANAVIAVGAIVFITFPATIFNQTFSANYDEILFIVAGWRRRVRRLLGLRDSPADPDAPRAPATATTPPAPAETADATPTSPVATPVAAPGRTTKWWFGSVLVLGAILGGLLNPAFGFNGTSVAGFIATLIAFAFGAAVSWFVAHRFRTYHRYGTSTYLKALPLGLGIATLCVVVSRVSHFQPGYLYGVVVSVAFAETLADRHNAHLTAISTVSTLVVALSAWLVWIPVNHVALDHPTLIPIAVLDDLLGSIFIGGLVGTVVGLLPLTLLPGRTLMSWRRDAWAALLFIAVFLLIEVELRPESGPSHSGGAPWVTVVVLFLVFGGGTLAMRQFFAHRTPRAVPAAGSATSAVAGSAVDAAGASTAGAPVSDADDDLSRN